MNFTSVLTSFVTVIPVLILIIVSQLLNIARVRRYQQYAFPAVTLVFAVFAIVVLYGVNTGYQDVLRAVTDAVPVLAGLTTAPWMIVTQNIGILLLFLVLKFAYRLFAQKTFVNEKFLGSNVVAKIYQYDPATGLWLLKPHLGLLRVFSGVLFGVSILITTFMLFAVQFWGEWPGFEAIPFPVIATLVLGEIFGLLNGRTSAAAVDEHSGEQDSATRIVNYASLGEIFRRTFGSRIIDDGVDLSNPHANNSHATLEYLSQSDDGAERLVSEFFSNAKLAGLDVDENLVYTSLELLAGNSALINTPFYADLTSYLSLPAYIRLLNGGKCLIVVGRDSSANDITEWITGGLEAISGAPDLWNVRLLNDRTADGVDVGVLRVSDLHNLRLLEVNDDFFRDVDLVILAEPSKLIATGQLGLGVVVSRLGRGSTPVYCGFDRNHDGLVDALSHLLKVNLTDVVATQQAFGASSELVWATEGNALAHTVLPGVSRYLGMGTEIASVALKYHVDQVEWVGGDRFPVTDMSWISGQYYRKITAFAEMNHSQRTLSNALVMNPNPLGVVRAKNSFLVVEDEFSNVYESLRLFGTRSTDNGFVNVLAENYLLRDYMVDNRDVFSSDPKAIPAIVPDYVRSVRNTALRLFVMLSNYDLPESVLLRELELVGSVPNIDDSALSQLTEPPVLVMLKRLFMRFLGPFDVVFTGTVVQTPVPGGLPGERFTENAYRLQLTTSLLQALKQLRSAYFLVEDEAEGRDYIGGCLNGHVAQTILPGQLITLGGKYYEVVSIGSDEHREEVVLRRAAEHITGRPVYRSLRSFEITESRLREATASRVEGEEIAVERRIARVVADTHGYLVLPSREDFSEPRRVSVTGLNPRVYVEKDVLRFAMPGADVQIRKDIAVMLNELFVTIFPAGHSFLAAVTAEIDAPEDVSDEVDSAAHAHDTEADRLSDILPKFVCDDDEAVYIIEDSQVDLGLLVAVERNWRRIFEIVTDYLVWVHEPKPEGPADVEASPAFVFFSDETEAETTLRAKKIAQAEKRGSFEAPKPPTLWQQLRTKIRNTWPFKRRKKPVIVLADDDEDIDVSVILERKREDENRVAETTEQSSDSETESPTETEPASEFEREVELSTAADFEAEVSVAPEPIIETPAAEETEIEAEDNSAPGNTAEPGTYSVSGSVSDSENSKPVNEPTFEAASTAEVMTENEPAAWHNESYAGAASEARSSVEPLERSEADSVELAEPAEPAEPAEAAEPAEPAENVHQADESVSESADAAVDEVRQATGRMAHGRVMREGEQKSGEEPPHETK